MKFLIAGFGSTGRRHLRNLLALGEEDILLYRTHHSTLPDDELAGRVVETDLQLALAHKPDAVLICNPTSLHMNVAIPAAEAGCHLFVEKPVADSLERIPELRAALRRGGGQLFSAFQFRFHPGLRMASELLQNGAIGKVVSARVHWGEYLPNWHPWEDYRNSYAARRDLGGGVVRTLCHPFDYMRWLLGEPVELSAFTGKLSDLELDVEDTAEVNLRFASGALGSLHLDYVQRPPEHKLQISGTEGMLRWDNADGAVQLYRASKESWETFALPADFERNQLFLAELRHFIDVAGGKIRSLCTLEDGVRAMEIAQAVLDSGQSGRPVRW